MRGNGQALVEFALALPAIIFLLIALIATVVLAVQVSEFQAIAMRELAGGVASSHHVYGISLTLSASTGAQQILPGQSLGEAWTRWMQRQESGRVCLAIERGWLRYWTGRGCLLR